MYKILFIIVFCAVMWIGAVDHKRKVTASAKHLDQLEIPKIELWQFMLLKREGNIAIIDTRRSEDYNVSHIRDAISIHSLGYKSQSDPLFDRFKLVRNTVLYSYSGVNEKMKQFANTLSRQGIEGIYFYSGGFREWNAIEIPVENGE